MKIIAKPIDVVATFAMGSSPRPYKFKYFQENGEKIQIKVDKIAEIEESHIAGINTLIYTCQSNIGDEVKIYQLKYVIAQYRWELYKI